MRSREPRFGDGGRIRPILPSLGMPCLSFSWQLITPPRWEISGQSTGLLSGEPALPDWPLAVLGMPAYCSPGQPQGTRLVSGETLRRLDELSVASSEELAFAEWFTRWDSGPSPLLVDRLATGSGRLRSPNALCSGSS